MKHKPSYPNVEDDSQKASVFERWLAPLVAIPLHPGQRAWPAPNQRQKQQRLLAGPAPATIGCALVDAHNDKTHDATTEHPPAHDGCQRGHHASASSVIEAASTSVTGPMRS